MDRRVLFLWLCVAAAGCEARLPDGKYRCQQPSDCPSAEFLYCGASEDSGGVRLCFRAPPAQSVEGVATTGGTGGKTPSAGRGEGGEPSRAGDGGGEPSRAGGGGGEPSRAGGGGGEPSRAGDGGGEPSRAGSKTAGAGAPASTGAGGAPASAGGKTPSAGTSGGGGQVDMAGSGGSMAGSGVVCENPQVAVGELEDRGLLPPLPDGSVRLPGPSAVLGDHTLWLFPQLLRAAGAAAAPENAPANYPTASVFADRESAPPRLLGVDGTLPALIARAAGDDAQVELWPTGLSRVSKDKKGGLVFFQRVRAGENTEVLVAPIADGADVVGEPKRVWSGDDPRFGSGVLLTDLYLFVHACAENTAVDASAPERWECKLARLAAGSVEQSVQDRTSYEVYTADGSWQREPGRAVPTLFGSKSPWIGFGGVANSKFPGYMALHAVGGTDQIAVKTAPKMSGPWTELARLKAPGLPGGATLIDAVRYADLADDPTYCSYRRLIAYSYATATDADGRVTAAETRLAALPVRAAK